jgi:hypothetical protein
MTDYLNPIAERDNPDSGKMITPEEAYRIKETAHFFCPDFDCKDPSRVLIPTISVNKNYFFRHKGNYKHEIRPETLLHKSAIRWFEGRTEFEVPFRKTSSYTLDKQLLQLELSKTECEYRKLKVLIPDVKCCSVNGFEFAIEIFVTSDISADKRKLINEFRLPVVRIDLSKFYKKHPHQCRVDLAFINENLTDLLTDVTLKSWIIPPSQESIEGKLEWTPVEKLPIKATVEQPKPDGGPDGGCLLGIVTLGLIYLFYPRKKTGKKYRS